MIFVLAVYPGALYEWLIIGDGINHRQANWTDVSLSCRMKVRRFHDSCEIPTIAEDPSSNREVQAATDERKTNEGKTNKCGTNEGAAK